MQRPEREDEWGSGVAFGESGAPHQRWSTPAAARNAGVSCPRACDVQQLRQRRVLVLARTNFRATSGSRWLGAGGAPQADLPRVLVAQELVKS